MPKDTENQDIQFDSENIFEEFSGESAIEQEVKEMQQTQERDIYFYLKKCNGGLMVLNIGVFLALILGLSYVFIQNSEDKKAYSFLSPICTLFLGNIPESQQNCYGATPILREYQNKISEKESQYTSEILSFLGELYAIENFHLSRKVSFLIDKTQSRLRPLEILSAFDEIKNIYAPIDKKEVRCYDITISEGGIMDISCDVFSSDWDTQISDLQEGDSINALAGGGTSISKASSFIHFLENHSRSRFQIIEKPNTLSQQEVQELPYTQKTTIFLKLRYNDARNLSF